MTSQVLVLPSSKLAPLTELYLPLNPHLMPPVPNSNTLFQFIHVKSTPTSRLKITHYCCHKNGFAIEAHPASSEALYNLYIEATRLQQTPPHDAEFDARYLRSRSRLIERHISAPVASRIVGFDRLITGDVFYNLFAPGPLLMKTSSTTASVLDPSSQLQNTHHYSPWTRAVAIKVNGPFDAFFDSVLSDLADKTVSGQDPAEVLINETKEPASFSTHNMVELLAQNQENFLSPLAAIKSVIGEYHFGTDNFRSKCVEMLYSFDAEIDDTTLYVEMTKLADDYGVSLYRIYRTDDQHKTTTHFFAIHKQPK